MTITVFGSAFTQPSEKLYSEAEQIGKLLAEKNITICSGGYSGVMEAISKGAGEANGKVIGVTVQEWNRKPNQFVTEEISMPNLMSRIMKLIELGDAYIIFKGGTGTLVEIASTLELMNKKVIPKKNVIFYTNFWKNVTETLKNDSESLTSLIERNVFFADSPDEIINLL